ncbi:hypothetical protein C8R46DRAFT_1027849 [Mycena filopes]|nr:hypothetical protein C8R46DRAFT_1027849 [Mycena filopes]
MKATPGSGRRNSRGQPAASVTREWGKPTPESEQPDPPKAREEGGLGARKSRRRDARWWKRAKREVTCYLCDISVQSRHAAVRRSRPRECMKATPGSGRRSSHETLPAPRVHESNSGKWETKLAWAARGQRDARMGKTDARKRTAGPPKRSSAPKAKRDRQTRWRRAPQPERCDKEKKEENDNRNAPRPRLLQPAMDYGMALEVVVKAAESIRVVEVVEGSEQIWVVEVEAVDGAMSSQRAKVAAATRDGGSEQSAK